MFKNLFELSKYAKKHGKLSAIDLPLALDDGSLLDLIKSRFIDYKNLVVSFLEENNGQEIKNEYIPYLDKLQEILCDVLIDGICKYPLLKSILDDITSRYKLFDKVKCKIDNHLTLFRLCSYRNDLKEAKDFYHCPISLIDNNRASRFGTRNDILWYLGYSREVCMECESRSDRVCIATFKTRNDIELNVVDLTQGRFFKEKETGIDGLCYIYWWLIACCYSGYDKYDDDPHDTYVIPQLFSKYIKENYPSIDGIKYYTVRNASLNPDENTYVNLAFFTRNYNEEGYDMNLCSKFSMIGSEQNVIIRHHE